MENETEVFIELIQPSVSLIIFGGGFDAQTGESAGKIPWMDCFGYR